MSVLALLRLLTGARRQPLDTDQSITLPALDELDRLPELSLPWRDLVQAAADLAVPSLCDWCVVTVEGTDRGERERTVAHPSNEARYALEQALQRDPLELNQRHLNAITTEALSTGKAQVTRPSPDWTLRLYGTNPSERYLLEELTPHWVAAYPLISRGSVTGAVTCAVLDPQLDESTRAHQARFARRLTHVLDHGRQIKELESAREALRQARTQVYSILDPDFGAVATVGKEWNLTYLNTAAQKLLQLSPDQHHGRSVLDSLSKKILASPLGELWVTALTHGDTGSARFLESWTGENRWLEARAYPLTGGGAALYVRDITRERVREDRLHQHEQELREAQKLESIGRLTGGVAHDFNNILMAINGHTELALRKIPEDHPSRESLGEVRASAERGAHLIRQLLTYSRKTKQQRRSVDLPGLVGTLEASLLRLLGEDVELSVRAEWNVPPVLADPNQLEQVIMNLAVNARDAMPSGGLLRIDIERRRNLERAAQVPAETPAHGWVLLTVTDHGVGIPETVLPHVFEPFFTTKSNRSGTGLGLSTVHGIVSQHGGTIGIQSESGNGTTVQIYLPACAGVTEPAVPRTGPAANRDTNGGKPHSERKRRPRPAPADGQGTILVAEDEERVLEFVCSTLRDHGYQVVEARNGADALAVMKRQGTAVRLLLTDLVMPYMGGRELGERLAESVPDIKVVYMSGYAENEISRNGDVPEDVVLLEKPFSGDHLLDVVESVLSGSRTAVACVT